MIAEHHRNLICACGANGAERIVYVLGDNSVICRVCWITEENAKHVARFEDYLSKRPQVIHTREWNAQA